ncbi:hypothetical protein EVAR_40155_1 [Eumeta japonica]|uniref:Uncharacterized protein n=1 Tax=Eumeta variegata TaxID=151549 RepID=A0A4C1YJ09_EUMVA|nr:hypothetical protein EVAR_40155_1 [Eumeta japonica]
MFVNSLRARSYRNLDVRNPRGVTNALPASWVGIGHLRDGWTASGLMEEWPSKASFSERIATVEAVTLRLCPVRVQPQQSRPPIFELQPSCEDMTLWRVCLCSKFMRNLAMTYKYLKFKC